MLFNEDMISSEMIFDAAQYRQMLWTMIWNDIEIKCDNRHDMRPVVIWHVKSAQGTIVWDSVAMVAVLLALLPEVSYGTRGHDPKGECACATCAWRHWIFNWPKIRCIVALQSCFFAPFRTSQSYVCLHWWLKIEHPFQVLRFRNWKFEERYKDDEDEYKKSISSFSIRNFLWNFPTDLTWSTSVGSSRYALPQRGTLELLTAEVSEADFFSFCYVHIYVYIYLYLFMFCVLLLSSFYFCFDVLRIFLEVVFCMSVFFFFPHPLKPLAFLLFQATWPSSVTGGFVIPFQGQPRLNKLTKLRNVGKKNFVLHKNKNHTSLEQHGVF